MMTLKRLSLSWAVALAMPLIAAAQQAPQTPPNQQQATTTKTAPAKPAPAKKAVVWNDDNIGSVRSTADNYQMAQAQQQEAQKAAAKQGANQPAADPSSGKTAEQLDSMIASKSHELAGEQDYLKNLQKQVNDPAITGIEKTRLQWRLQSHTITEQTLQSDIKQLQADKDALAKKQAASSSSSQPQSQ